MKHLNWLLTLGFLLILVACGQDEPEDYFDKQQTCTVQNFIEQDSGGVFTGTLAAVGQARKYRTWQTIALLDEKGDTISFRVEPDNIKYFNADKLRIGRCIHIEFETEIIKENNVELNRVYHVKRISYP